MYYYNDGENEVGPFDADKLRKLANAGLLGAGTLVRVSGSNSWVPYGQLDSDGRDNNIQSPETMAESSLESPPQQSVKKEQAPEIDEWTSPIGEIVAPDDQPQLAQSRISSIGWLANPPTPWRRYAARFLDTTINGSVVFFLFGFVFYAIAPATADEFFSIFESESAAILDVMATAVAASILGGLLIGVTGSTLGKWVFGIKVTRLDETRLGIGAGLTRDFNVLVNGLFLGIPLLSLFTMWSAYNRLRENRPASWDEGRYIVWHRPSGTSQTILNCVGLLLILLSLVAVAALGAL